MSSSDTAEGEQTIQRKPISTGEDMRKFRVIVQQKVYGFIMAQKWIAQHDTRRKRLNAHLTPRWEHPRPKLLAKIWH
jgi:hypothetical protein